MTSRRNPRADANQVDVVKALRQAGCAVQSLGRVGNGCPDILVCRGEQLWLMELKDGTLPPSKRKLTSAEYRFHAKWPAYIPIVHSVAEALAVVGVKTSV